MQPYQPVLDFWFVDHGLDDWFQGGPEFDARLAERFTDLQPVVARGEAAAWRETPDGRLAEIIVLDQFSRQLHRGKPEAFAQDKMALVLAQEAIAGGHDMAVEHERAMFFYMPFMHAESLILQDEGVRLFEAYGVEDNLNYMRAHRDTIARFGRFPFRNKALGRQSTDEEIAYIKEQDERKF
jgi:uncharacterized protein (DUF924 family)